MQITISTRCDKYISILRKMLDSPTEGPKRNLYRMHYFLYCLGSATNFSRLCAKYVLNYQTYTTDYCASYSYTSYGRYYCSNYDYYYTSLYSSGTIISLYVFGGLFLGVGIILLAVGGYLIWSGKLFNETTRVQPAMVQNV
jgi:hypothetical protein